MALATGRSTTSVSRLHRRGIPLEVIEARPKGATFDDYPISEAQAATRRSVRLKMYRKQRGLPLDAPLSKRGRPRKVRPEVSSETGGTVDVVEP